MNKKTQLESLFDRWENSDPNYLGKFVRDGMIHDIEYETPGVKILFLVKEANDIEQSKFDLAEVLNTNLTKNFGYRMAEWSFGILNDFPVLSSARSSEDFHESLKKSSAVMNLKKIGGASKSDPKEIHLFAKKDKIFILEEIKILEPNIIVGGVGDSDIWKVLFEDIKLKDSGYDIKVGKCGQMKIIDFYHPSYRVSRAMTYSLLQNVVRSESFENL